MRNLNVLILCNYPNATLTGPYLLRILQFPLEDPGANWEEYNWCRTTPDSSVHVGDFDGDSRLDVMCRYGYGDDYAFYLTDGDGFLINVDYKFGRR